MSKKSGLNVSYVFLAIAGVFVLHSLILRATRVEGICWQGKPCRNRI